MRRPSRITDLDRLTIVLVAAPHVRLYTAWHSFAEPEQLTAIGYMQWWNGLVLPARAKVLEALKLPTRRKTEIEEIDSTIVRMCEAIHSQREHMIPADEAGYPTLGGPHGFSIF